MNSIYFNYQIIFGTAVLMVIYAPVRCIQRFLPKFLPYKVIIHRDAPVSDLSLELILLQVRTSSHYYQ